MSIETKPNLSRSKFEQCTTDILNLSGCTQVYNIFNIQPTGIINSYSGYQISGITYFKIGGVCSISIGSNACTKGGYSISIGQESGFNSNASSVCNIEIGYRALYCNTGSTNNVAIGSCAMLSFNTNGLTNTIAIGNSSMMNAINGDNNVGVGYQTLCSNTVGNCNVGISYQSLGKNTSGAGNIGIGYRTLCSNTTGMFNIAINHGALINNVGGSYNVGIGNQALGCNTSGNNNIAINQCSLSRNTSGCRNIAIGFGTLTCNTTASDNIAIGSNTLVKTLTFGCNIGIGLNVLTSTSGGTNNVGIGSNTLNGNIFGACNVAVGNSALCSNINACENVAVGSCAMFFHKIGNNNVAIGSQALINSTGNTNNIGIGMCSIASGNTIVNIGRCNCAYSNCSLIVGGSLNKICVNNTGAALINTRSVSLTGSSYVDTVVVPNLAIWCTPAGSGNILCWNSTTKKVGMCAGLSTCIYSITGNSSNTGFTVTHNLDKTYYNVEVLRNTSPFPTVCTGVSRPTTNTLCVTFTTPPTTGIEYKVLITS